MAGYDGFSMSNNARQAYADGLVPASKVGHGIPAALVERFCGVQEWHHASNRFNRVNFFSPDEVLKTFGVVAPDDEDDYQPDADAIAALAAHKATKNDAGQTFEGCRVEWLEWSGTRKHPTCCERSADGCKVVVKGQTATITLPGGQTFQKRLKTNGFSFEQKK